LKPSDGIGHLRIYNLVTVDRLSGVKWNNSRIDMAELANFMAQIGMMNPEPQIILQIENGADCNRVRAVRRIMAAAPICRDLQYCGEGRGWVHKTGFGIPYAPAGF
jgi:hypothetical protein